MPYFPSSGLFQFAEGFHSLLCSGLAFHLLLVAFISVFNLRLCPPSAYFVLGKEDKKRFFPIII